MYPLFRPLLFRLEPESAHRLTLNLVRMAGMLAPASWLVERMYASPERPVHAFGLNFRNPVGLAAGYDKDGVAVRGLATLGFGHIEVGTVTLCPQAGNPLPRVFRLVEEQALINRMGFPGRGAEFVVGQLSRLRKEKLQVLVGVNLGKNKDTPLEEAAQDYTRLMEIFSPLADYLAINISSPNTAGLRRLQGRQMLEGLLGDISRKRQTLPDRPPILVKLAPDLDESELEDALQAIQSAGMDGVIASNTTLSRPELSHPLKEESGGLSGRPLTELSMEMLKNIMKMTGGSLPVVSAGGVMDGQEAKRRLEEGACLVQVYSGLVYAGPGLVKQILSG